MEKINQKEAYDCIIEGISPVDNVPYEGITRADRWGYVNEIAGCVERNDEESCREKVDSLYENTANRDIPRLMTDAIKTGAYKERDTTLPGKWLSEAGNSRMNV